MSEWHDASTSTYTAEAMFVAPFVVVVCLDDEGPLRPAFYWSVERADGTRVTDGWSMCAQRAKSHAVAAARRERRKLSS